MFSYTIKKQSIAFISVAVLITLISCKRTSSSGNIKQGIVEFEISYINTSGKNIPVQLLPKTMYLKFNQEHATYTIEDRLGLFSISNIIDFERHSHNTLVKVFDKKYIYRGTQTESSILFASSEPYIVNETNDTIRIAGLLCRKAQVKDSSNRKSFEVYSTLAVNLDKPNFNTPFYKIDGLILGFTLQLKSMDMQFRARKVEQKEIANSEFDTPVEYKFITKKQMEDIITTILP